MRYYQSIRDNVLILATGFSVGCLAIVLDQVEQTMKFATVVKSIIRSEAPGSYDETGMFSCKIPYDLADQFSTPSDKAYVFFKYISEGGNNNE